MDFFGFSNIFHNQHDLFRTQDDDLSGGLKAVPRSYFRIDTTCRNSKRQEGNYSFQNEKNKIGPFGSAQQIYPQGLESKLQCQVTMYFSDPTSPDLSEIEDVCCYVVSYTGKRHNTSQDKKEEIQDIITG